jgi:preprotein translocase subunit SecD
MAVMEARLAAQNIRGYELRIDYEANEIIVRFPERFEPDETITMLGETALLTFREGLPHDWQTHEDIPLILTGADVKRATALFEDGNHTVLLEFKESGIEAFSEATGRLAGTLIPISIWLDDYCFAFPTVSTKITGGSAIISGSFTADEAVSLAQKINSGALPFKLEGVVKN